MSKETKMREGKRLKRNSYQVSTEREKAFFMVGGSVSWLKVECGDIEKGGSNALGTAQSGGHPEGWGGMKSPGGSAAYANKVKGSICLAGQLGGMDGGSVGAQSC